LGHFCIDGENMFAVSVGVGSNPDSISAVRRTNGGSGYNVPFRIKPDSGKVSEKLAAVTSPVKVKQVCGVFHDEVARSKLANETEHFGP
jgi:hypothetical protein